MQANRRRTYQAAEHPHIVFADGMYLLYKMRGQYYLSCSQAIRAHPPVVGQAARCYLSRKLLEPVALLVFECMHVEPR
jgi:hypothetical protein